MKSLPWWLLAAGAVLTLIGLAPIILPWLAWFGWVDPSMMADTLNAYLQPYAPVDPPFLGDYGSALNVGLALIAIGVLWLLLKRRSGDDPGDALPITMTKALLDEAYLLLEAAKDLGTKAPRADHAKEIINYPLLDKDGTQKFSPHRVSPFLYRWLGGLNRTALCISGGGIRSAAFGLGVIQAFASHQTGSGAAEPMAQKSLLAKFNYLSTVSGGGYIGSWLTTWVRRQGYEKVWLDLVRMPKDDLDPGREPDAVRWLRGHSSYLTPQVGLTSPDTLTDIAILLRNLLLNWLLLLPAICAGLIVMKIIALLIFALSAAENFNVSLGLFAFGALFLIAALRFELVHRPTRLPAKAAAAEREAENKKPDKPTKLKFVRRCLIPSILAASLFTLCVARNPVSQSADFFAVYWLTNYPYAVGAALGVLIYTLSYVAAIASAPRAWRDGKVRSAARWEILRWMAAGAVYGFLAIAIAIFFLDYLRPIQTYVFGEWLPGEMIKEGVKKQTLALVFLGVPAFLTAQLFAEMIFVGLTSNQVGSDDDREWLGRAAGVTMFAIVGWIIVMYLAFIGSEIAWVIFQDRQRALIFCALIFAIGYLGSRIGKSRRTPVNEKAEAGNATQRTARFTASIAAVIFILVLTIGLSALIDWAVLGHTIATDAVKASGPDAAGATRGAAPDAPDVAVNLWSDIGSLSWALLLFVALTQFASYWININRFSLHSLYRNRLVRAFLGATHTGRDPNPFTQFDSSDNPRMYKMWPSVNWANELDANKNPKWTDGCWQPFHVINIALNITSSREHPEWQERKAASFTVSPLHAGSAVTGFRWSDEYGGPDGISIGTAMAISGAAASPNQGYNSSPAVAFLMALLNVRLGWWLGNPGEKGRRTFRRDGPRSALKSLFYELAGATDDQKKFVYLSDGGHFENLALYEMVRRRCRYIVVSDAGCDPKFAFEDLGNAVRKVFIDLGVPIRFHGLEKLTPRAAFGAEAKPNRVYHAIGEIDYAAADGPDAEKGLILYIKPSFHGTERSASIRSYAFSNRDYPHDDTANQWFAESQFESYRALGFEITEGLLEKAARLARKAEKGPIKKFELSDVIEKLADDARRGASHSPPPPPAAPVF